MMLRNRKKTQAPPTLPAATDDTSRAPPIPEPPGSEADAGQGWRNLRTFEGLRYAPFRWYMGAMAWFNAAIAMQMLVRGYLAYKLTGSFASVGLVSLGSAVPMLLLSAFGGVIADRRSRRAVLQLGQIASLVIAVIMAVLLFGNGLAFWHLVVASIVQGLTFALVMPSRQALLPEIIGMDRMTNAIPLQTAGQNLMQILSPGLGGFMIDWFGPGWTYVAMSGMYAMSVGMFCFVTPLDLRQLVTGRVASPNGFGPDDEPNDEKPPVGRSGKLREKPPVGRSGKLRELGSGFAYLWRDRTTVTIIWFTFVGSILGMPIRLLLPGYAGAVFGDDGSTLGLLQVGFGTGALIGALALATLRFADHRGLVLVGSVLLMGVALVAFSLTGVFWLAWLGLLVVGVGSSGHMVLSQVLIHEYVDPNYRGRVMAIYMMQFSLMAIGSFAVSLYMESAGAKFAIGSLGAVLILSAVIFVICVPRLRSVA